MEIRRHGVLFSLASLEKHPASQRIHIREQWALETKMKDEEDVQMKFRTDGSLSTIEEVPDILANDSIAHVTDPEIGVRVREILSERKSANDTYVSPAVTRVPFDKD